MSRHSSTAALVLALLGLGGCGGDEPAAEPGAASSLPADHPPVSSSPTGNATAAPAGPVQFRVVAEYNTRDAACAADPVPSRKAPAKREVTLCDTSGLSHLLEPAAFTGGVESAEAGMPQDSTSWVVTIELDRAATRDLERLTRDLADTGQQIAIVHGGRVLSAPAVQSAITGGTLQITGSFGADEAEQIAAALAGG